MLDLAYAPRAVRDLTSIEEHLMLVNPHAISIVLSRIESTVDLLRRFPLAGLKGSKGKRRRIAVVDAPYMVYYVAEPDRIVIMHLRHTSRRPLQS